MQLLRKRTTCIVPEHGTDCEPSREKDTRYNRTTEKRITLKLEFENAEIPHKWHMHLTPETYYSTSTENLEQIIIAISNIKNILEGNEVTDEYTNEIK